jgi:hypothetical protein
VLKDDLRDLHARKLREIGVDPEWKGIPAATFQQKMATLKHHQTITAKVIYIIKKKSTFTWVDNFKTDVTQTGLTLHSLR